MNNITGVKKFMYAKHKGQKYGQHPFVIHPLEVFTVIELLFPHDIALQKAALLHDTLEDTDTTYDELVSLCGREVADLVEEVTKTAYNTFPHLKTQRGIILKYADRLCNLSHLEGWSDIQKQKYFKKSKFWKTK